MNPIQNRRSLLSRSRRISAMFALVPAALLMAACASPQHNDTSFQPEAQRSDADDNGYGRVESIQVAKLPDSDKVGMTTVVGGLIGGLIANQIGGGNGKMLATAAGAGTGAYAGHEFEMKNRPHEVYRIRVQLDSGDFRTVSQDSDTDLTIGSRVHIDNGHVYRY